jgi:flagellar assembly protein FliH
MSNALPKEQQTAYQRWEIGSFGDSRPRNSLQERAREREPEQQSVADFAAQIAKAREDAVQAGYSAGFQAGHSAGLNAGRAEAAQELAALRQVAAGFGAEIERANELIADQTLELALDIAKAMLKTALHVKPELVLPIVGAAIRYLPSVQQPALLFLHPADAALVRERMGEELSQGGWRIADDPQMERGGCRIETASNQIDASAATRWQRIAAALDKEADWLA